MQQPPRRVTVSDGSTPPHGRPAVMSKNGPLDRETQELDIEENAQTSNKTGKHSAVVKPSSAGPDSHSEHKASVPGAFGSNLDKAADSNDTPLGQWAPADKAKRPSKERES